MPVEIKWEELDKRFTIIATGGYDGEGFLGIEDSLCGKQEDLLIDDEYYAGERVKPSKLIELLQAHMETCHLCKLCNKVHSPHYKFGCR